tara:strand:- start:486 stop:1553 length:1068 start_codon:yes stop_codon:yes gene_type:complete
MKREVRLSLTLVLLIALTINFISAVEIILSKEDYQPRETLQVEITGNFIDVLTKENILLYEQGTPRSQPVISDLIKQSDTYYFYAVLPNTQNNFSLKIENARYTEAGEEKTETIVKDFKIKTTNDSVLQINPAVIKTSDDFSIKIKSLYKNQDISTSFEDQEESFSLVEDNEKTIVFSIANIDAGDYDLIINDYTIPVFIIKTTIENETEENETEETNQTIPGTNVSKPEDFSELTEEEVEEYIEDLGETEAKSCSDIGFKCEDDEECDGETVSSKDGNCCLGKCEEEKERSFGWVWGILILLILGGGVAFFYLKSKRRIKPKSTDEILEDKQKKFNQRMENKPGEETRGSLGKI